MRASINQGTPFEISWSHEDVITPLLVENISKAGNSLKLDWRESKFYNVVELLLERYHPKELEELLYDEDPEISEIGALILQNPVEEVDHSKLKQMVRLYYPVMIILISIITSDRN